MNDKIKTFKISGEKVTTFRIADRLVNLPRLTDRAVAEHPVTLFQLLEYGLQLQQATGKPLSHTIMGRGAWDAFRQDPYFLNSIQGGPAVNYAMPGLKPSVPPNDLGYEAPEDADYMLRIHGIDIWVVREGAR